MAGRVLLKIVYALAWRTLGLVVVLFRGYRAIAAESWCSGMRTRCCAGRPAGCGTSRRTALGSPRWHGLCRAGAGPRCSLSHQRRSWPGTAGWRRRSTTPGSKVQALVTHGGDDTKVPISISMRLKELQPSLVTFARFPGADHLESWNIDRARYTSLLESFLSPVAP